MFRPKTVARSCKTERTDYYLYAPSFYHITVDKHGNVTSTSDDEGTKQAVWWVERKAEKELADRTPYEIVGDEERFKLDEPTP